MKVQKQVVSGDFIQETTIRETLDRVQDQSKLDDLHAKSRRITERPIGRLLEDQRDVFV